MTVLRNVWIEPNRRLAGVVFIVRSLAKGSGRFYLF